MNPTHKSPLSQDFVSPEQQPTPDTTPNPPQIQSDAIHVIIQKLDHLLRYFWKYQVKVKDARDLETPAENTPENATEASPQEQDISWKSLEMNIFEKNATDQLNFIQTYYVGKVFTWLQRESLTMAGRDTTNLTEAENEEIYMIAVRGKATTDTSAANDQSAPTLSAQTLQSIWDKYDALRKSHQQHALRQQLKLFLVIRRYLVEGMIQYDAIPERLNLSLPLTIDDIDADFEHLSHHHHDLLQQMRTYNTKSSTICLRFLDIIHKYVMNLRFTGPASLRTFFQTVLIPLLSRAADPDTASKITFAECKLTYIVSTYILELIPKFQFYVLEFVTESVIPLLPDALSYCVLELLFRKVIFERTPYSFLREYIARVIRVHRHLYMQKHEFVDLVAHVLAYDMDLARKDAGMDSYFECNSLIFSQSLLTRQDIASKSKATFILLNGVLQCAKEQYNKHGRVTILGDAMKLASLYLRNRQDLLPSGYRVQTSELPNTPLRLTAAEAEYFIQEYVMHNLEVYVEHCILFEQQDASEANDARAAFRMIYSSVLCYDELSYRLDTANALMQYHEKFLLRLLGILCQKRRIAKPEIMLLYHIICRILCKSPSMTLFVTMCKKSSFREEFLHPVEQYMMLLVSMCVSNDADLPLRLLKQSVLCIVQFLRDALVVNRSMLVNGRVGKLNDTLSVLLELSCATDDLVYSGSRALGEFSRQALLYFVREMQRAGECDVREENWTVLRRLLGKSDLKVVKAEPSAAVTTK